MKNTVEKNKLEEIKITTKEFLDIFKNTAYSIGEDVMFFNVNDGKFYAKSNKGKIAFKFGDAWKGTYPTFVTFNSIVEKEKTDFVKIKHAINPEDCFAPFDPLLDLMFVYVYCIKEFKSGVVEVLNPNLTGDVIVKVLVGTNYEYFLIESNKLHKIVNYNFYSEVNNPEKDDNIDLIRARNIFEGYPYSQDIGSYFYFQKNRHLSIFNHGEKTLDESSELGKGVLNGISDESIREKVINGQIGFTFRYNDSMGGISTLLGNKSRSSIIKKQSEIDQFRSSPSIINFLPMVMVYTGEIEEDFAKDFVEYQFKRYQSFRKIGRTYLKYSPDLYENIKSLWEHFVITHFLKAE